MIRKVGAWLFCILGLLAVLTGCQPPETKIAQLEPYVGPRPGSIRPLKERPKVTVKQPPIRGGAPESGWIPPGGISKKWQHIVIHHSGSDRSTPQGMRDWHVNGRGWDELGYHFVIGNGIGYPDGKIFVGQRWTQQMHGAHCKTPSNHYNEHGIGVCLIGNLNNHAPTPKQVAALARLSSFLCEKCGLPKSQVLTHGGVTNKTECPGRCFTLAPVLQQMSQNSVWASSK